MRSSSAAHYSFIIVGCGPVGAVTALLLAPTSRPILVLESSTAVHPLPRAVHIDAHSARILASLLPAMATLLTPMQHCTFTNSEGQQQLRFTSGRHRSHGSYSDFLIDQPAVERALRARLSTYSNVTFIQGETVTVVRETANGPQHNVYVTTTGCRSFGGDHVLACDGARSTVRSLLAVPMLSLASASAFTSTDWWVIDGLMPAAVKQQQGLTELGVTQLCGDETRPVTIVNLPGDKLRLEVRRQEKDVPRKSWRHIDGGMRWWRRAWDGLCYMLLVAWSTIAPLVSSSWSAWKVEAVTAPSAPALPSTADAVCPPPLSTLLPPHIPVRVFTVVRCAAYTMQSLIAASFLSPSHRVVLLGDAAHLCPPYLGQALCLGLRDAASLAFRLRLSSASQRCNLTEWEAERRGEAAEVTVRSGKVGRLLEVRGAWQCWLRDTVMRAVDSSERMKAAFQADVPVYGRVLYAAGRRPMLIWPQIDNSDEQLLHDSAVSIIGIDCDARQLVRADEWSSTLGVHFARLDTSGVGSGTRWRQWVASVRLRGMAVAVVRPDHYVLGIYALTQQRTWVQYLLTHLTCSPSTVMYCERQPFPVIDDLLQLLMLNSAD